MRTLFPIAALGLAFLLSACAGGTPVTRSAGTAPLGFAAIGSVPAGASVLVPKYAVREVRVEVPGALQVSEANLFYPVADIVWRGEPKGDRHVQVRSLFLEGFGFGTAGMDQGRPVIVEATVRRFHALTEKTRYTVGGVYSIRFDLTVRDAETGAVIEGPRFVIADAPAAGGRKAIEEEAAGRTQRVAIIENLAQVIRRELSAVAEVGPRATPPVAPDAATASVPVARGAADPAADGVTARDLVRTVQVSL
jgi:hypothetical protein